jgi:hypothetical protein
MFQIRLRRLPLCRTRHRRPHQHHRWLSGVLELLVEYASPDAVRRGVNPFRPPGERSAADQGKKRPQRTERLQTRAAMRPSATDDGGASATPRGDGDGDDAADAPARPKRAREAKAHVALAGGRAPQGPEDAPEAWGGAGAGEARVGGDRAQPRAEDHVLGEPLCIVLGCWGCTRGVRTDTTSIFAAIQFLRGSENARAVSCMKTLLYATSSWTVGHGNHWRIWELNAVVRLAPLIKVAEQIWRSYQPLLSRQLVGVFLFLTL